MPIMMGSSVNLTFTGLSKGGTYWIIGLVADLGLN